MGAVYEDAIGHRGAAGQAGANLTAGAVGTTAVGTIAPTTSAGATPTVTVPTTGLQCNDNRGTFELSPVTGGGAQAAGVVARVFFAKPYAVAPAAVIATCVQITDNPNVAVTLSAGNISVTGFDLLAGAALTTAKVYRISYTVQP